MDITEQFGVRVEPNRSANRNIKRLLKRHPEFFNIEFEELEKMKRIGSGSFGTVFRAVLDKQPVAVKCIDSQDNLENPDVYKYLIREIVNLQKMNHDNVLKYIGLAHAHKKEIYLVTDLVEGSTLDKMQKKLRKNIPCLIEVFTKVAFGMRYISSQSMLHRDLKPGNVLISNDFRVVKLCDFGLSIQPDNDVAQGQSASLTRKFTCAGTEQFMAPEVKTGETSYASDVYSFGIMLAIVLGYPKKILTKKDFDFEHFKKKKEKQVPNELVDLVQKCTQKEPNTRPTFSAIASELVSLHNTLFRDRPRLIDEESGIAMDVATSSKNVAMSRASSKGQITRKSRVKSMEIIPTVGVRNRSYAVYQPDFQPEQLGKLPSTKTS